MENDNAVNEIETAGDDREKEVPESVAEQVSAETVALPDENSPADDQPDENATEDDRLKAVMLYSGKQYVIQEGDLIVLPCQKEFFSDTITVSDILMATNGQTLLGTPRIEGATVHLIPESDVRVQREVNFKRRRRKNSSKRTKGVRKYSVKCRVSRIDVPGFDSQVIAIENSIKETQRSQNDGT